LPAAEFNALQTNVDGNLSELENVVEHWIHTAYGLFGSTPMLVFEVNTAGLDICVQPKKKKKKKRKEGGFEGKTEYKINWCGAVKGFHKYNSCVNFDSPRMPDTSLNMSGRIRAE
jgi:hypothetical protein